MTLVSPHATIARPASRETVTMQAAPVRATAIPSLTTALRAVESLLMSSGQRTARRNAWTSVLEDRRRAKDRVEAQRVLDQSLVTRP
ncbi:hypothetical protein QO019_006613 [Streptomyces thermodiastaticus]|uniref:Uncharacterized protein n=2 Tax=Streptomyces TaxID=1883 RepID=A0ABU0KQJ8_9ACTN|nr:hypothetical protein [Streptomyces thermodiastaticus]